jgi:hypothetical protein
METRARRARRLLDVLRQLHEIEERKKLELEIRQKELERSQREAMRALDADDALHGLFVDTTARFLKSLARQAREVAEAHDVHSKRLLDRAVRMRAAERLKGSLEQHAASRRNERELSDIIERYAGWKGASLPQD